MKCGYSDYSRFIVVRPFLLRHYQQLWSALVLACGVKAHSRKDKKWKPE
nr:MAG TPA: hypothetical protein [Caudoviricetes sp.]